MQNIRIIDITHRKGKNNMNLPCGYTLLSLGSMIEQRCSMSEKSNDLTVKEESLEESFEQNTEQSDDIFQNLFNQYPAERVNDVKKAKQVWCTLSNDEKDICQKVLPYHIDKWKNERDLNYIPYFNNYLQKKSFVDEEIIREIKKNQYVDKKNKKLIDKWTTAGANSASDELIPIHIECSEDAWVIITILTPSFASSIAILLPIP